MSAVLSCSTVQDEANPYAVTEALFERVCLQALAKGNLWKPEVTVSWRPSSIRTKSEPGWYWKDRLSDDAPVGPFLSKLGALTEAIAFHDVDCDVMAGGFDATENVLIQGLIAGVREAWRC